MARRDDFRPFASRGRRAILAILVTFTVFSALGVTISIWATKRSAHRASVIEVAARQRTLAERYVKEVLLAQQGARVDPNSTPISETSLRQPPSSVASASSLRIS